MLRKLSVLLVAWHCLATINAQPLNPKPVIITASLQQPDNTTPRVMVLNFLNPFIKIRKSAAFDEKNELSSSEEMVFTQNMTVMYNDMFINLLVSPGDSVHLTIDATLLKERNFKWLSISGSNATVSTQANQWHHYFSTHYNKTFQRTVSYPAMVDSIRLCYQQCTALLDSYATATQLSPEARKWAASDIKYTVSYWASDFLTVKDSFTGKPVFNHTLFSDPFFDQYGSGSFASMMFPYHLGNYAHTLLKTDSSISKLQQQNLYKEASEKALRLLSKEPKSLSRDYMLFNFLTGILPRSPQLLDSLPAINTLFSDPVTYRYFTEAAARIRNPSLIEKPVTGMFYLNKNGTPTAIPSVEVLKYFGSQYPGKVIYLDVYATWCVPCLKEMEYTPALKTKLDPGKVVFINLCLQSERDNWLSLVKAKNLHGENFFLDDDASRLAMGMYRIEGFPTYMLLNSGGQLKTDKAPRPSEEKALLKAINDLIR